MTSTRRLGRVAGTIAIGAGLWMGSVASSAAGLWQWTDGAGHVHKSRSLEDVPEAFRATATELPGGPSASPSAGPTVPAPRTEPAAPARRPPPQQTSPASGAVAVDEVAEAATDRDGHDRAWWESQVVQTRQEINDLEVKLEHLKSEGIRSPIVRKEREARREFAKTQDELEKAKGKLQVDLPEAAAKAGAPASWLVVN